MKLVLSADPTLIPNSYFSVMHRYLIYIQSSIALVTGGRKSWSLVDKVSYGDSWYTDAIFYKGRGYAPSPSEVIAFDVESFSSRVVKLARSVPMDNRHLRTHPNMIDCNVPAYLVETTN